MLELHRIVLNQMGKSSFQNKKNCFHENIGQIVLSFLSKFLLENLFAVLFLRFVDSNQWTGFYMITASVMKELIVKSLPFFRFYKLHTLMTFKFFNVILRLAHYHFLTLLHNFLWAKF